MNPDTDGDEIEAQLRQQKCPECPFVLYCFGGHWPEFWYACECGRIYDAYEDPVMTLVRCTRSTAKHQRGCRFCIPPAVGEADPEPQITYEGILLKDDQ